MLTFDRVYDDGRPLRLHVNANDLGIDVIALDNETGTPLASVYLEYRDAALVLRYWDDETYDSDPTGTEVLTTESRTLVVIANAKREKEAPEDLCICGHPRMSHVANINPEDGKPFNPPYDIRCTECGCLGFTLEGEEIA